MRSKLKFDVGRSIDRMILFSVVLICCFCCSTGVQAESAYANLGSILTEELSNLESRVSENSAAIQSTRSQINAHEQRIAELEAEITTLKGGSQSVAENALASLAEIELTLPEFNPASISDRYSASELDQWVRSRYRQDSPIRYADISPRTNKWASQHLIEHGYTQNQIAGLDYWVKLHLHDATHGGLISPRRLSAAKTQEVALKPERVSMQRTVQRAKTVNYVQPTYKSKAQQRRAYRQASRGGGCSNGQCSI